MLGDNQKQAKHEFLYWEFHERGFQQAALYQGRWKGIRKGSADAPIALYDQRTDIAETNNVAADNPELASKIGSYLQSDRSESEDWKPIW